MKLTSLVLAWVSVMLIAPLAKADQSDFNSLCQAHLKTPAGIRTCGKLQSLFFSSGEVKEFAPYTPTQVGAPKMTVDDRVLFLALNDPNYLSGMAYCYFVFRKWISPSALSPDDFGSNVTGFSVLNEQLHDYQEWLDKKDAGKACKALVKEQSGIAVANLEKSIQGRSALITLNPYALIREKGADLAAVLKEMALTTNHERIHAYQVICPDFEKRGEQMWAALSPKGKEQVRASHPDYNWSDSKVAAREYAAFALEKTPEKIKEFVGKCAIQAQ